MCLDVQGKRYSGRIGNLLSEIKYATVSVPVSSESKRTTYSYTRLDCGEVSGIVLRAHTVLGPQP